MADSPLVWERPEPAERRVPSPLSRDRIVQAAVALADTEGLEAVSLRKVAGALGAGPMRLYRYVDTKEELLELMVDAVYAEIPAATGSTWPEVLRSFAHGIRDAALRHEWFADLLGGRPQLGPATLAYTEGALAGLRAAGIGDVDAAMGAIEILDLYLIGAVRKVTAERRAERATGVDEQQWQRTTFPYLTRMFATGNYPVLEETVRDAVHRSASEVFERGLDYLLDGIEKGLKS